MLKRVCLCKHTCDHEPVLHSGGHACVLHGWSCAGEITGHREEAATSSRWYVTFLMQRMFRVCCPPPHVLLQTPHLPVVQLSRQHICLLENNWERWHRHKAHTHTCIYWTFFKQKTCLMWWSLDHDRPHNSVERIMESTNHQTTCLSAPTPPSPCGFRWAQTQIYEVILHVSNLQ